MSIISNEINRQIKIKVVITRIKVVTKSLQSRHKVVLKSMSHFNQISDNLSSLYLGFIITVLLIRAPALRVVSCQSAAADH